MYDFDSSTPFNYELSEWDNIKYMWLFVIISFLMKLNNY